MKVQTLKYGLSTGIGIALILGIVVFVEAISYRHHKRFDLTGSKRYTLSDQTTKILKSLKKEIKVTGFFNQIQRAEELAFRDLLEQYSYTSSMFSFEFVDPDKNPGKAKRYQITSYGTTVVGSSDKEEKIFETGEEKLTNAILRVTRDGKKIVYFLRGHGEKNIEKINEEGYSFAKKAIEDSNYEVKEILLATTDTLPDDANLLIIAGPQKPILKNEFETIKKFIEINGKVFFMIDPGDFPRLTGFLKQYGMVLGQDIVIDRVSRIFGADPSMPVITQYSEHPIVNGFSVPTFFPLTRSVKKTSNPVENISVVPLVMTSPNSWAETDYEKGEAVFEKGKDIKGPIPIGMVASLSNKRNIASPSTHLVKTEDDKNIKEGRIVVIGDSDFASNSRINVLGNSDFFLNVINWLLEEDDLISIRPKGTTGKIFTLTKVQQKMIFWIPLVIMPGVFILSGIAVYKKRKNMK